MLLDLRRIIKERILRRWHIPYSPVQNLSAAVYRYAKRRATLTVVDLGAHTGAFTNALTHATVVKRALLVEPLPYLAASLRTCDRFKGFEVEQCAVGRHQGNIVLHHFPNAPYVSSVLDLDISIAGMSEIARGQPENLVVPMRTLDCLINNRLGYETIDLLKVDVQGLENDVIAGAGEALARTEAIYCEVSYRPVYAGSCTFFDIYSALMLKGFKLLDVEPGYRALDGELLQADAFFCKAD